MQYAICVYVLKNLLRYKDSIHILFLNSNLGSIIDLLPFWHVRCKVNGGFFPLFGSLSANRFSACPGSTKNFFLPGMVIMRTYLLALLTISSKRRSLRKVGKNENFWYSLTGSGDYWNINVMIIYVTMVVSDGYGFFFSGSVIISLGKL